MKKILILSVLMVAAVAHADYLYWMVADNPSDGFAWDTAKVVTGDNSVVGEMSASEMADLASVNNYASANIGAYGTGYNDATSFFIELYNGSSEKIASASIGTADDLKSFISRNTMTDIPSSAAIFSPTAGSFQAVPEPTSGLLFLVGGMLLGLRRKRRV